MDNYSPDPGFSGPGLSAQATGPSSGGPASSSRAASSQDAGLQRADGTPVRVLVVDDEPSLAELLASVLRYEGWTVKTAGNGADAVGPRASSAPMPWCWTSCFPTSTAWR